MPDTAPADLVFTGGPVHTVDPARSRATSVAVRGERIVAVGPRRGTRTRRPGHRGGGPGGQAAHPRLPGRARPSGRRRPGTRPVRPQRRDDPRRVPAPHPRVRRRRTPTPSGSPAAAGRWRRSPAACRRPPSSTPSSPTARRTSSTAITTAPGSTPAPWSRRDRRRHPRPRRRPHRARRRRRTDRHAPGGRGGLVGRLLPRRHAGASGSPACCGPRRCCTRSASPRGRTRSSAQHADLDRRHGRLSRDRRATGALTARVRRRAVVGPDARHRADRRARGAARRPCTRGRLRCDQREDHAGRRRRERHRGPARPLPDGCGCASDNSGISFVDPVDLQKYVTELDARGFQVHFHALGDRAVREALDAVEAARTRQRAHRHPARTSPISRWSTPTTSRRFRELGATANIQALWAAHEPQMDELTIPFLGPERSRVAVPVRRSAAFGRHARGGQRLAGQQPGPDRGHPRRGQPRPARRRRRGTGVPAGAADRPGRGARRVHGGQRVREPPRRRDRHDHAGHASPTWSSSTATRSRRPTEEIGATRVLETFVGGERVYAAG